MSANERAVRSAPRQRRAPIRLCQENSSDSSDEEVQVPPAVQADNAAIPAVPIAAIPHGI